MNLKLKTKKVKKSYPFLTIYVSSSSNNTKLVAANEGNVVAWSSAGAAGFKGAKKSTPHAANEATVIFMEKLKAMGLKSAKIILKGIFPGRDAAVKTISSYGIAVNNIFDKTPYAHNGCRAKGRRRV
jgi:small subunit ribosomal protein S11